MSKNEIRNIKEEKFLNESMMSTNQMKNYQEDLKKTKNSTIQDSNRIPKLRLVFKVKFYQFCK